MANITLVKAQEMLDKATAAYSNALDAANYTYMNAGSNRTVTRQRLSELKAEMNYWQGVVNRLDGTSSNARTKVMIPRDIR